MSTVAVESTGVVEKGETGKLASHSDTIESVLDQPIPCRRLRGITGKTPPLMVAKEIARCLHEFKFQLILNVVKVLGIDVALDLFFKTSEVQHSGGEPTSDGIRRKSPGGVFLSLVKGVASDEERKEIFQREKELRSKRRMQRKKERRLKNKENTEEEMEIEKISDSMDSTSSNTVTTTCNIEPTTVATCNMEPTTVATCNVEPTTVATNTISNAEVVPTSTEVLMLEFESMNGSELDFGIDFT